MNGYRHNGYFIISTTNTGSCIAVRLPDTRRYKDVINFVSNDYIEFEMGTYAMNICYLQARTGQHHPPVCRTV